MSTQQLQDSTISSRQMRMVSTYVSNNRQIWVPICRKMLIDNETKNIQTRALFWTKLVNQSTQKTIEKIHQILLDANIKLYPYSKYLFKVNKPLKYLHFLCAWNGLKQQQMQTTPKCFEEFQSKAKNWLNGRKAPNYALTLFPEMIHTAEYFGEQHSYQIFKTSKECANLLSTTLRYSYLAGLCSERVLLSESGRTVPLLIPNVIKSRKSAITKIFTSYGSGHQSIWDAATYFEGKYEECLQSLSVTIKKTYGDSKTTMSALCVGTASNCSKNNASNFSWTEYQHLVERLNRLNAQQEQQNNSIHALVIRVCLLENEMNGLDGTMNKIIESETKQIDMNVHVDNVKKEQT